MTPDDGPQAGKAISTDEVYVTPGYFDTLQIPALAGRTFAESDGPASQPVAVVNQVFARKFFRGADPVGRYLTGDGRKLLIVGVVAGTVSSSASRLTADTAPLTTEEAIYIPAAQVVDPNFLALVHVWIQPSWIVRVTKPAEQVTAEMERALGNADPALLFSGFYSMNDLMAATLATQRIEVALLAAMGSLALLLSAVGIFALVANLVAQREREIAIRMALGATVREAMIHIGGSGVVASALGLAVGLALCAGGLRALRTVLYGVGVYDAPTILAALSTLFAVTLLATIVPALRVARIDPGRTLREE